MNLFAQQGSREGTRICDALKDNLINGVIVSPKDISQKKLRSKFKGYKSCNPSAELLFDPQFYAAFSPAGENHKLGHLLDGYDEYFRTYRRNQLMQERTVSETIKKTIQFQKRLGELSAVISPNILISRSLDSVEMVISMNFLRLARSIAEKQKVEKPLYLTLAVSREALFDKQEMIDWVNELTALEERPDGFYLLISSRYADARTEIFNADVIKSWLYLNYALSINGYKVINGYSDILAPFLCAVGGYAGATGWWSNLRSFSLERFEPRPGGGRLPIQRYLSCALLNRITHFELDAIRNRFPEVVNGLETDSEYSKEDEPLRNREIAQNWEALQKIGESLNIGSEAEDTIVKSIEVVQKAQTLCERITASYPLDPKSNGEHLPAMEEGLRLFRDLAELNS